MFKDFKYDSLADVIWDFKKAYDTCYHELRSASIGLPLSHNEYTGTPICWRVSPCHTARPHK